MCSHKMVTPIDTKRIVCVPTPPSNTHTKFHCTRLSLNTIVKKNVKICNLNTFSNGPLFLNALDCSNWYIF